MGSSYSPVTPVSLAKMVASLEGGIQRWGSTPDEKGAKSSLSRSLNQMDAIFNNQDNVDAIAWDFSTISPQKRTFVEIGKVVQMVMSNRGNIQNAFTVIQNSLIPKLEELSTLIGKNNRATQISGLFTVIEKIILPSFRDRPDDPSRLLAFTGLTDYWWLEKQTDLPGWAEPIKDKLAQAAAILKNNPSSSQVVQAYRLIQAADRDYRANVKTIRSVAVRTNRESIMNLLPTMEGRIQNLSQDFRRTGILDQYKLQDIQRWFDSIPKHFNMYRNESKPDVPFQMDTLVLEIQSALRDAANVGWNKRGTDASGKPVLMNLTRDEKQAVMNNLKKAQDVLGEGLTKYHGLRSFAQAYRGFSVDGYKAGNALSAGAPPELRNSIRDVQSVIKEMDRARDSLNMMFNGYEHMPPSQTIDQWIKKFSDWLKPFVDFPRRYLNADGQSALISMVSLLTGIIKHLGDSRGYLFMADDLYPKYVKQMRAIREDIIQKSGKKRVTAEIEQQIAEAQQPVKDAFEKAINLRREDARLYALWINRDFSRAYDILLNVQTDDSAYTDALKILREAVIVASGMMGHFNSLVLKSKGVPDFKAIAASMDQVATGLLAAVNQADSYVSSLESYNIGTPTHAIIEQVKKAVGSIAGMAQTLALDGKKWADTEYGRFVGQQLDKGTPKPQGLEQWEYGQENPFRLMWQKNYQDAVAPLREVSQQLARLYKGKSIFKTALMQGYQDGFKRMKV